MMSTIRPKLNNKRSCLAISCLFAVGLAPKSSKATEWNLTKEWSFSDNPNGVWTLLEGQDVLMMNVIADFFATCPGTPCYSQSQPAWARDTCNTFGDVPAWTKSLSTPLCGLDLPVSTVGVHGGKNKFGVQGSTAVAWKSPINGSIEIRGGVWLADTNDYPPGLERPMGWALYHNNQRLTGGLLTFEDSFDSASPQNLRDGDGGAVVVYREVAANDTISLEVIKQQGSDATWVGIDLAIVDISVPTISRMGGTTLILSLFMVGVFIQRRRRVLRPHNI